MSARMHCLAERRSKIGQSVTGKYANAMRVSNSIAAATARPTLRALQTCGKLFQRATPRAFVWFAARPESSEETCASLSPRFPPCATEPSDESYVAPTGRTCDAARNCVRKTTAEEDAALVEVAAANPFTTAGQTRNVVGLDVSEELVGKRLLEDTYLSIIEEEPHVLDGAFPDGCFTLQQDLSPVHTSRAAKDRLEGLCVMVADCPPLEADMNIIENMWGIMKNKLSRKWLHNAGCDELRRNVQAEWDLLKMDRDVIPAL
ncbi:hypothetical protein HPB50_016667 [Hyalomma asiaticum]|uniref:Uncharacterized protein n=1 Tax=Hyalomma asiaticum TaxID=266040 RepID=A0ACB7RRR5_HYAAI|nr:hypothetical protein HPB50_016667 [Hyalomma asiaticum]